MSEPPGWTIRRTTVILAASLLLVVVAGVPALAGSSIAPVEVEADTDTALTLTVTEPTDEEAEDYGDTARVVVRAPTGFSVLSCGTTPVGWDCTIAEDGTGLTLTRTSPLALADSRDFGFSVHTAGINKQYEFRVTQADGPPAEEGEDPPTTIPSRPVVTVKNGKDPAPPADGGGSQDGSTDGDSSGSQADGGSDGSGSDGGGTPSTGNPSPAPDADGQDTATGDGDSDDNGSADGSTAPRRTQGRSSGTTLEITPGEPAGDDPAIAPPAVADDAAAAPPGDGEQGGSDTSDSTAAAAAGTQPSDQPDGGAPWQQWVGAAMLLAGLATIGVRWFRERRAD